MTGALPRRVALDTSFVDNYWKKIEASRRTLRALKEARSEIRLPTPMWAEIGRGPGGEERLADFADLGAIPAPFDVKAARYLSGTLGAKIKAAPGRYVWGYDAMIFACALSAGCDAIVTDNESDFLTLQAAAGDDGKRIAIWTSSRLAPYSAVPEQLDLSIPPR